LGKTFPGIKNTSKGGETTTKGIRKTNYAKGFGPVGKNLERKHLKAENESVLEENTSGKFCGGGKIAPNRGAYPAVCRSNNMGGRNTGIVTY